MLSGVASDEDEKLLTARFSTGELVRMMNLLQQTMAGFTRNASRRMDAELCCVNLCQPELKMDEEALNARLTRLEEQVATGQFVAAEPKKQQKTVPAKHNEPDEERPPIPDDRDAPAEESPSAPLRAVLSADRVILECANSFTMEVVNKPEILALVARKASAMLGRTMIAQAVDVSSKPRNNAQMERLLNFGRAHQDIIHIKE